MRCRAVRPVAPAALTGASATVVTVEGVRTHAVPHIRSHRLAGQRDRLRRLAAGWGLGRRSTTRHRSARLHHAFDRGINFVDTAELYGAGHSEEVIGQALQQWSGDRIYVATKVQPTVWPDPDEDDPQMRGRYPRWHLRNAVDNALRRLQVERLDVLQLHGWLASGVRELDWLETLNELIIEGKIEYAGVSIRDYRPDEGVDIAKLGLVASIQVVFNLFEQRPAHELFPAGDATGTAMIARVPFDSGSLVGHWTEDTYASWEPGSVPHTLFRGDRFAETLRRTERTQGDLRTVLPDPGRGRDAVRAELPPGEDRDPRDADHRERRQERRVLRRPGIPARSCWRRSPRTTGRGTTTNEHHPDPAAATCRPCRPNCCCRTRSTPRSRPDRWCICRWAASSSTAPTCRSAWTGSTRTASAPGPRWPAAGSCCRRCTTAPAAGTPPTRGRSWRRPRRSPSC